MQTSSERVIKCIVTGAVIEWRGFGRPPLYCPEVKAARAKANRQARYRAKREALGKSYSPRD